MLQEDANEQELREVKEQLSKMSLEHQNLSSKVKNQREQRELMGVRGVALYEVFF